MTRSGRLINLEVRVDAIKIHSWDMATILKSVVVGILLETILLAPAFFTPWGHAGPETLPGLLSFLVNLPGFVVLVALDVRPRVVNKHGFSNHFCDPNINYQLFRIRYSQAQKVKKRILIVNPTWGPQTEGHSRCS